MPSTECTAHTVGGRLIRTRQHEATCGLFGGKYKHGEKTVCYVVLSLKSLQPPEETTLFDLKIAKPNITHNSAVCLLLLNRMQMISGCSKVAPFNSTGSRPGCCKSCAFMKEKADYSSSSIMYQTIFLVKVLGVKFNSTTHNRCIYITSTQLTLKLALTADVSSESTFQIS